MERRDSTGGFPVATKERPSTAPKLSQDESTLVASPVQHKPSTSSFGTRPGTSSSSLTNLSAQRRASLVPWESSSSHDVDTKDVEIITEDRRDSIATTLDDDDLWPKSDSSDDELNNPTGGILKRSGTMGASKTRLFRAVRDFGRPYNSRYDYLLPNDQREKHRNEVAHQVVLRVFDGRLHLAPVVRPSRVLDLGCGPGTWCMVSKLNPSASVLGVDIEPVRPDYQPSNCFFQKKDFCLDWSFKHRFDFIHLRMLGSAPPKKVFEKMFEYLNPGGWVEITEWIWVGQSPDRSLEGTALEKWYAAVVEALGKRGIPILYPLQNRKSLSDAGFDRIVERKYASPGNTWPPGKKLKMVGSMMCENVIEGIDTLTLPFLTGHLGWSPEDAERLRAQARIDAANPDIHAYKTLVTVYAQKPRSAMISKLSLSS